MAIRKTSRRKRQTPAERAVAEGYRSGLEVDVKDQLEGKGCVPHYEENKLEYLQPAKRRRYTPDFLLTKKKTVTIKQIQDGKVIVIETKGRFTVQDRQKHLFLKEQFPKMDLRFVFTNPNGKISKGSKTSYAMWCDKHGFQYAKKLIPDVWLAEV